MKKSNEELSIEVFKSLLEANPNLFIDQSQDGLGRKTYKLKQEAIDSLIESTYKTLDGLSKE